MSCAYGTRKTRSSKKQARPIPCNHCWALYSFLSIGIIDETLCKKQLRLKYVKLNFMVLISNSSHCIGAQKLRSWFWKAFSGLFLSKKLSTTHYFNFTITFYMPSAFKKCTSYGMYNSVPKYRLPKNCALLYTSRCVFEKWKIVLTIKRSFE